MLLLWVFIIYSLVACLIGTNKTLLQKGKKKKAKTLYLESKAIILVIHTSKSEVWTVHGSSPL
jgi:hypothetical protein